MTHLCHSVEFQGVTFLLHKSNTRGGGKTPKPLAVYPPKYKKEQKWTKMHQKRALFYVDNLLICLAFVDKLCISFKGDTEAVLNGIKATQKLP